MAVFIAAKLLGKQNSENYRALYGSNKLVFHFGTPMWQPKLSARRKREFATKVPKSSVALRDALVIFLTY